MKLQEFLLEYPEVTLATSADNEDILRFFDSFPMKGTKVQVRFERRPDFFAFLKQHSPVYYVFLLRVKGKVEGIGSLVLKEGYINGSRTGIGYLGDLRVRAGMKNSAFWRRFYSGLIKNFSHIDEFKETTHLQTAIMGDNVEAKKSLADSDRYGFHYHLLSEYRMVNIIARKGAVKSHGLRIRRATPADKHLMQAYYQEQESKKQFGHAELYKHSLLTWKNFSEKSFIIAFDSQGIVGMAGTWYPGDTKKMMVDNLPLSVRLARPFSRLFGIRLPKNQGELKSLFLTHLNVKDVSVLTDILNFIFKEGLQGCHVVSFSDFEQQNFERELKGFLVQSEPMSLYQVTNENDEHKLPELNHAPGLEMALI